MGRRRSFVPIVVAPPRLPLPVTQACMTLPGYGKRAGRESSATAASIRPISTSSCRSMARQGTPIYRYLECNVIGCECKGFVVSPDAN